MKSIGEVAKELSVSTHTLRYYEKIDLLNNIAKSSAGHRLYSVQDIESLKFIKRAQRMQFTLDEIQQLISLDKLIETAKPQAQSLVKSKLKDIDENLREMKKLKVSLKSMLSACESSDTDEKCPIIEGMKK